MSETRLSQEIRLGIADQTNATMFRNNTGRLQNNRGEWVNYGLFTGSSDLIGWTTITVRPDMVGQQIAVFTAIEVKTPTGKVSREQANFIARVAESGGLAGIARSVEDAKAIILNSNFRESPRP